MCLDSGISCLQKGPHFQKSNLSLYSGKLVCSKLNGICLFYILPIVTPVISIYVYLYEYTYKNNHKLPTDRLSIVLAAHMRSHNGHGPGIVAKGPRSCGSPKHRTSRSLGLGPWSQDHINYCWTYVHQGQSIGKQ